MNYEQIIAIGTFVTVIITTYIGISQYFSSKRLEGLDKSRYINELFDKRFEIFRATQEILSIIVTDANCSLDQIQSFNIKAQQGYFMFDDQIYEYLMEIRRYAIQLSVMTKAMENLTDKNRQEYIDKHYSALIYLSNQLNVDGGIFEKFKPYLRPSIIK